MHNIDLSPTYFIFLHSLFFVLKVLIDSYVTFNFSSKEHVVDILLLEVITHLREPVVCADGKSIHFINAQTDITYQGKLKHRK